MRAPSIRQRWLWAFALVAVVIGAVVGVIWVPLGSGDERSAFTVIDWACLPVAVVASIAAGAVPGGARGLVASAVLWTAALFASYTLWGPECPIDLSAAPGNGWTVLAVIDSAGNTCDPDAPGFAFLVLGFWSVVLTTVGALIAALVRPEARPTA